MRSEQYPSLVMIIRHGEKPGDPAEDTSGGKHLSALGSARAAALPSLFTPNPTTPPVHKLEQISCDVKPADKAEFSGTYKPSGFPAGAPTFSVPNFLFAAQNDSGSHRPLETITPLGQALAITPQTPFDDDHYQDMANEILNNPKTYADQVVLICWHHGKAPDLAKSFGVSSPQLQGWDPWNPTVFDLIFEITWGDNNVVNFEVDYQGLLFGDTQQSTVAKA
jgi:hypothetical protein